MSDNYQDEMQQVALIDSTIAVLTESVFDLKQFVDNVNSQLGEFSRQLRCEELKIVTSLARYQNILLRMHLTLAQSKLALERNINSSTRVIEEHYRKRSEGRVCVQPSTTAQIVTPQEYDSPYKEVNVSISNHQINPSSTSDNDVHQATETNRESHLSSVSSTTTPSHPDSQLEETSISEMTEWTVMKDGPDVPFTSDNEIDAETEYAHRFLEEIKQEVLPFVMKFSNIGKKFKLYKQASEPQQNSLLLPMLHGYKAVGTQTEPCACSKNDICNMNFEKSKTHFINKSHNSIEEYYKNNVSKNTDQNRIDVSEGILVNRNKNGNHTTSKDRKTCKHKSKSEPSKNMHVKISNQHGKHKPTNTGINNSQNFKDKYDEINNSKCKESNSKEDFINTKNTSDKALLSDIDNCHQNTSMRDNIEDKQIDKECHTAKGEKLTSLEITKTKCKKLNSRERIKEKCVYRQIHKSKNRNKTTEHVSIDHKNSMEISSKQKGSPKSISQRELNKAKYTKDSIDVPNDPGKHNDPAKVNTKSTSKSKKVKHGQALVAKVIDINIDIFQNETNLPKKKASLANSNKESKMPTSKKTSEPNTNDFTQSCNIQETNVFNSDVIPCIPQLFKLEVDNEPVKNIRIYYEDSDAETESTLVLEENYGNPEEFEDVKPNIVIVKCESLQENANTESSDSEQILKHCTDPKLVSKVPMVVLKKIHRNICDTEVSEEISKHAIIENIGENSKGSASNTSEVINTIQNIDNTQSKCNENNKNAINLQNRLKLQDYKLKYKEVFETTSTSEVQLSTTEPIYTSKSTDKSMAIIKNQSKSNIENELKTKTYNIPKKSRKRTRIRRNRSNKRIKLNNSNPIALNKKVSTIKANGNLPCNISNSVVRNKRYRINSSILLKNNKKFNNSHWFNSVRKSNAMDKRFNGTYQGVNTVHGNIPKFVPPKALLLPLISTCDIRPEDIVSSVSKCTPDQTPISAIYKFNQQDVIKKMPINTKFIYHEVNEKLIYLPPDERNNKIFVFNEAVASIYEAKKNLSKVVNDGDDSLDNINNEFSACSDDNEENVSICNEYEIHQGVNTIQTPSRDPRTYEYTKEFYAERDRERMGEGCPMLHESLYAPNNMDNFRTHGRVCKT